MNKTAIWHCRIDTDTPTGPVVWKACFLFEPQKEHIKEALRDTIANESQMSQTKANLDEWDIHPNLVMKAAGDYMAGLAWVLRQDFSWETIKEFAWEL